MKPDLNTKVIIILLIVTALTFLAHRVGFLNTFISLTEGLHVNNISVIQAGHVQSKLSSSDGKHYIECSLNDTTGFNLCGISIHLGKESSKLGLDLSQYDYLKLSLKYTSPDSNKKIRAAFRNYHKHYSKIDDVVSLKYNTITYSPFADKSDFTVPLSAFQVEAWWKAQYNISFDDSQIDFSNVNKLDFSTDLMPATGQYKMQINSATLYGKFISETNLLKLFLVIWLVTIIALLVRQKKMLEKISNTDHLTGLYNRRGMRRWVNGNCLFQHTSSSLSLFYFDIDDFKKVNDSYGHQVGDKLLKAFSERIKKYLESQIEGNIFSRLSGDEFIILFRHLSKAKEIRLAKDILNVLQAPLILENHSILVHISLGIAQTDTETQTLDALISRADSAMYYAKKEGKNQYKVFDQYVAEDIFFKKQVAEKIEQAITDDKFHLNFMPIFDSKTLKISAVEVLIRSTDPLLNKIGPNVFIPIAEELDLIKKVDLWVIEQTFKQISIAKYTFDTNSILFCINISALQLNNPFFTQQVKYLLTKYDIYPNCIEFELTETSLIKTDERSILILEEIHSLGIKLALDDFGTGYTAFNQLIHYPVDALKIDKSFIDNIHSEDQTYVTMVQAILSIAKSYQLKTIAEGIETYEQYQYLAENHCDYMQGYLFAKPMPWNELESLLISPNTEMLLAKYPPPIALKSR